MTDDTNPKMALQTAHTEILCRAARGEIDLNELASAELAARGMNEHGRWVGFEQAQALHKVRAFTGYDEMLAIAQRELGIEKLEARKSDDLDFHDLAVWQIRAALMAAYKAGLSHWRGFGWYPPPDPPPRKRARPTRHEQRVRACQRAMRDLYRINGLGEPTIEAYLYAAGSRMCRGDLRDVWLVCARRAAKDAAHETQWYWEDIYMGACRRAGVDPSEGRRLPEMN